MKILEYIQSTGTQWLDTGIKPSTTTLIKAGVNVTEATGGVIVGHCNSDNSDYRIFNYQQTAYFDYGGSRINGSRINVNTYYDIEMGNYYLELNGTRVLSGSTVTGTGDYQNHNILTGYSPAESVRTKMKLYYLQIYNNGDLVFDGVPAKDENDVVCFYDKVSGSFFYNQGTGDYTAGPEVVTEVFLIESGGDYYTVSGGVLTNIGSTLNAQLFTDYGLTAIPDWSDYSSLANPSVLCWDEFSARSMTATTTGIPGATVAVSQKVPTGSGIQAVTINSDNDTLYSVSFDDGANWWKYANGAWVQVSAITDGMTKAEVEAISASAWGEKNTGFARFRFTLLDGNGYMTSIRVDYAGGGGGDSVEWTQIQSTGTKIAEININGTTQDVYAPNGGSTYTEGDGIDISAQNEISVDTTFTEASTRANIASGDSLATIWGKIKKFFSDLKTVAFTGAYSDLTGTSNVAVKNANNNFSANQTIDRADGTVSEPGSSGLTLGNNIPNGTEGNSRASIRMYGNREYYVDIRARSISANRAIELPDKAGTIALTDDIPTDFVSKANGGTFNGGIGVDRADGTADSLGNSTLTLGNSTPQGTAGNSRGNVVVFGTGANYSRLRSNASSGDRVNYLPDKAGTLVVESDLATPINNGTSIALSDFMSIASGITISDSDIRILNNHVSVLLVASGGVSVGANGTFGLGTIKSAYRPSRQAECAAVINRSTSGQVYVPATVDINYTNGYARVICPDNNVNYGNATYPWSTSVGFWFDYWL